jgi:hypothetical protein
MNGAKSTLNNYSNYEVDRFNAMVADYNSRCGSFRYRSDTLEGARREIEPYRNQLQSEGRRRFAHSPTGALSPQAPSRPIPDATVQAIERKLNEPGYEAGIADGVTGSDTRSAIIALQQDRGLAAPGVADHALLLQLQRAPAPASLSAAEIRPATTSVQLSPTEAASLEAANSTDRSIYQWTCRISCVSGAPKGSFGRRRAEAKPQRFVLCRTAVHQGRLFDG